MSVIVIIGLDAGDFIGDHGCGIGGLCCREPG